MMNERISDCVAIWIDHRMAIMVYFPGDRFQDGKNIWVEEGLNTGEQGHSLQHRNRHRQEALKHFYNNVILQLKHMVHVNDILIMGPGPAKFELRHRIDQYKLLKDQMSETELKAFASHYFDH
jgi:hypothetical protein